MEDNSTADTLAGDAQLTSADGGTAVAPDTLTLAEIESTLGKKFKDKETALKAMKDTFSYVGKKKEDIAAEVAANAQPTATPEFESRFDQLSQELFYTKNPQYESLKPLIASMGSNPAEVVDSEAFKQVYEKIKVADEVEQKRSVVSSSPRLAQVKTGLEGAVAIANSRNSSSDDVALALARTITDSTQG